MVTLLHKYKRRNGGTEMKNKTSSYPRPNPKKFLESMQFQELMDYADERQQDIFVEWLEKKEDFQTTLQYKYALLDEIADYLHTDQPRYAVLRLGSLLGTVESFERILFERREDQWAQVRFQKEAVQVKHLPEVIQALETHGAMFHAELGKYLGMNPSTLTEAMKKILETGAVQAGLSGKYKIYTLTDAGLRYGRELRKKKRGVDSLDDAFQTIRERLENMNSETEREIVKAMLYDMLDDGMSIEVHPNDTLHLSYYSPHKRSVVAQDFTVHKVLKGKLSSHEFSFGGIMAPPIFKNKNRRLLNNNFMPVTAEA